MKYQIWIGYPTIFAHYNWGAMFKGKYTFATIKEALLKYKELKWNWKDCGDGGCKLKIMKVH